MRHEGDQRVLHHVGAQQISLREIVHRPQGSHEDHDHAAREPGHLSAAGHRLVGGDGAWPKPGQRPQIGRLEDEPHGQGVRVEVPGRKGHDIILSYPWPLDSGATSPREATEPPRRARTKSAPAGKTIRKKATMSSQGAFRAPKMTSTIR